MPVYFYKEKVSFYLGEKDLIRKWIQRIITAHHFKLNSLNIIFCNDPYLLEINRKYLKHNTLTDIITFDLSENKNVIEGEIYISMDRVKENAKKYKSTGKNELHRIMIHGVLHLLGYKDKSVKDKKMMREKEDECIQLFLNKHYK